MARRTATAILYVHKPLLTKLPELAKLERAAKASGWSVVRTVVDEAGCSYPLSRGAIRQLFLAIEAREAQAVLVPSMRHLGGGPNSVLSCIAGILAAGGHVVSLTSSDELDTTRKGSPPFLEMVRWHRHAEEVLVGELRRQGIRRSACVGRHGGPGGGAKKFPDTDQIGQAVFVQKVPKNVLARQLGRTQWYVRQRCMDYLKQLGPGAVPLDVDGEVSAASGA